jgi:hypothetical protein
LPGFWQGNKFRSLENPVGFREGKTQRTSFHFELLLTRQTDPAFGSSPVDDSSTRFGSHTFEKAVISSPFNSTGLECSFHCIKPFIYISYNMLLLNQIRISTAGCRTIYIQSKTVIINPQPDFGSSSFFNLKSEI